MVGITREQVCQALAMADDGGGEEFELAPAKGGKPAVVVELKPVSPADYLRCCVRRVKGERERYVAETRKGIVEGREAANGKKPPSKAEVEKQIEEALVEQMERQIDSGLESQAALVACSMGFPADEAVEARLMRSRRLPAAYAVAQRLTHEQPDFFDDVAALIWGARETTTSSPDASEQPGQPATS